MILPGFIDPHVHLRDPGQTEKEDFFTGTAAALAGGFTTVLDMPNNAAPITTLERLEEKKESARKKIVCDVGFFFGTLGDNGEEFEKVKNLVWGLKVYLNQTTGGYIIDKKRLRTIYNFWTSKQPILVHAEDEMVETVVAVVEKTRKRTHVCHVSSKEELEPILEAKKRGLPFSVGVTAHHLFLSTEDEKSLGPFGKMRPPLRSRRDVAFLWDNLDLIDMVESDHAPHTSTEKRALFPPNGVPGLETTLPLLLSAVHEERLKIDDILRLCYESPTKIFNLPTDRETKIEVDYDKEFVIEQNKLQTKSGWTPFHGKKVRGKVRRVWLRDIKVFEDDTILVKPGFGKIIRPE